jgi:excinuclease ABC subunit C
MPNQSFDAKSFVNTLTNKPGVYLMLDALNTVIYVGKAKNLKKRVASYFTQSQTISPKTKALVAQIAHIDVIITHTENEALILENTLIKQHQPRYNILLRDDKTYPYIFLSAHPFPRLSLHRGAKRNKGRYFGPYPHASSVQDSLQLLQKLFLIRLCHDSFFRHRSRPCLQYQIHRCTAPCVGLIDPESYHEDVHHATLLLEGKSHAIIDKLVAKMQAAAQQLKFEKAAKYRDQINQLRTLQEKQYVSTEGGNVDVIASVVQNNVGCVQVLTIRDGRQLGSRAFFPVHIEEVDATTLLSAFLPQYYLNTQRDFPDEIVINQSLKDENLLKTAISQHAGKNIHLHAKVRSTRAKWLTMTLENAQASVLQKQPSQYRDRLTELANLLKLECLPQQMECFDISHTQGEATVAACVVFDSEGVMSSAYRRFNITNITPGDDYAAMRQALTRRYVRQQREGVQLPDIVFIDGGKGQVQIAKSVLEELQLQDIIRIIGVAKGVERKPGLETLILAPFAGISQQTLHLRSNSPALHLIQQIRDEAHRFAVAGHRGRREKQRKISMLEQIDGIGAKRRQQLITYFGGLQGVMRAGVDDLASVPGISRQLAQRIYDFFTHQ